MFKDKHSSRQSWWPNFSFATSKQISLGIDISASAVKLVALKKQSSGMEIFAAVTEKLPAGAVQDKQISDPSAVAKSINNACNAIGVSKAKVFCAVSNSLVMEKRVDLAKNLNPQQIAAFVELKASKLFPLSLADLSLDYTLSHGAEESNDNTTVCIAACRRSDILARQQVFQGTGLDLLSIEMDLNALVRAYQWQYQLNHRMPETDQSEANDINAVAMVDLGADSLKLVVFSEEDIVYSDELAVGANQLKVLIQEHFDLTPEEAEDIAFRATLEPSRLAPIIDEFANKLMRNIARLLKGAGKADLTIDRLVLTGGLSQLDQLAGYIVNNSSIPAAVFDTSILPGVSIDPSLTVALGLALGALQHESI